MAVLIPNLYCNWYISGGPSSPTVQIGRPPQVSATCSREVGYISSPASTGQLGVIVSSLPTTVTPTLSIGQSYPKPIESPVHHCKSCGY